MCGESSANFAIRGQVEFILKKSQYLNHCHGIQCPLKYSKIYVHVYSAIFGHNSYKCVCTVCALYVYTRIVLLRAVALTSRYCVEFQLNDHEVAYTGGTCG